MTGNISESDIYQAVREVMHPAINRSLVELGMVKDITVNDNKVTLTLVLPFPGIPTFIKDHLINSLRRAIAKLSGEVDVKIAEMSEEERQAFLAMEQESWKGL